ncbi:hypothetical protein BKA69DRAFT_311823 [Paraphysoderma sedebokerense]|nr:hypothetical protein BKA69DRAFT_311823 [Paraphysoderma sedebokerense]
MPHDAQSPPGVLLCEPGFITFLPINELEEESDHFLPRIPIPIPISSSNHPNEETFEVLISHAISLPSTSTTYPTLLLQSYSNDFYRLYATSFHSSSSYPTFHIHYLDSLPPSTFDRVFGMPVSHDHYEIVCLDRRNNIISCVSLDFDDLTKPLSEHSVYATLDFRQSTALPDVYTTKHVCKYLRQRSDLTNSNRNESGTQSNNHASQNIMQSEPVNQSQNAVAQPQEYIQFTQSHQRQSSASSNMMRIPQPRQSQYFPPSQQPYIPQQNQIPTSFRPPQFQSPEQLYRPPHRHSMHQAQMSSFHRPPQRAPFGRTPIIVPNYPVPYSSVTSQQNHYAGANRPPSVLGSVPSYPQITPANNMVFVRPLVQRSTSLRRPNMNRPAPNGQFPQQLQHQVSDPFRAPPNPMFYRRSYIDPNHSNLLQSVPSFVPPLTPRPLHNHPNFYMNRGPARPSQTVAALTMANTVYRPQSPQQVTRPGYLPPNRAPQRQSSLRRPNIQSQSIITQPHTPLQALAPSQVQNLSQKQKSPVLAISQSQISQRNSSLRRLLVSTSVSPTNLSPESNTPSPISSAQNTESSVPEEKEPEETEEERQEREKLEAEMKRKKRLEMRKFIAREIFETEKNYARNLGILESYFINPLTKAVKTSNQIVSPVFIRIVFNFCNELKEFSDFFSKILEDVVESWDLETSVVGKTFLDNVCFAHFASSVIWMVPVDFDVL